MRDMVLHTLIYNLGRDETADGGMREDSFIGSGMVWYKGVGWDWMMAKYTLEELQAKRSD